MLSATVDFPPCMLLRRMLECFLTVPKQVCASYGPASFMYAWRHDGISSRTTQLNITLCVQNIGDILRCPSLLASLGVGGSEANNTGEQVVQATDHGVLAPGLPPSLLPRLQTDVARCTLADCSYSPYTDSAKQAAGKWHPGVFCRFHVSNACDNSIFFITPHGLPCCWLCLASHITSTRYTPPLCFTQACHAWCECRPRVRVIAQLQATAGWSQLLLD